MASLNSDFKRAESHESVLSNQMSFAEEVADALCSRARSIGNSHPSVVLGRDKRLMEDLIKVARAVRTIDSEVFTPEPETTTPELEFVPEGNLTAWETSQSFDNDDFETTGYSKQTTNEDGITAPESNDPNTDDSHTATCFSFETIGKITCPNFNEHTLDDSLKDSHGKSNGTELVKRYFEGELPSQKLEVNEERVIEGRRARGKLSETNNPGWTATFESNSMSKVPRDAVGEVNSVHLRLTFDNSIHAGRETWPTQRERGDIATAPSIDKKSNSKHKCRNSHKENIFDCSILPNKLRLSKHTRNQTGNKNIRSKSKRRKNWESRLHNLISGENFRSASSRLNDAFNNRVKNVENAFSRIRENVIRVFKK